jgi:hypothetical protein
MKRGWFLVSLSSLAIAVSAVLAITVDQVQASLRNAGTTTAETQGFQSVTSPAVADGSRAGELVRLPVEVGPTWATARKCLLRAKTIRMTRKVLC